MHDYILYGSVYPTTDKQTVIKKLSRRRIFNLYYTQYGYAIVSLWTFLIGAITIDERDDNLRETTIWALYTWSRWQYRMHNALFLGYWIEEYLLWYYMCAMHMSDICVNNRVPVFYRCQCMNNNWTTRLDNGDCVIIRHYFHSLIALATLSIKIIYFVRRTDGYICLLVTFVIRISDKKTVFIYWYFYFIIYLIWNIHITVTILKIN